jgi:hypothetical protein
VSFDALTADLALRAQPAQFVARLKKLVTELPLPQTLPPEKIGRARRIDATADLCALAKQFQNCLASYTSQINAGACAIYLWDDPAAPTVCLVKTTTAEFGTAAMGARRGRMYPRSNRCSRLRCGYCARALEHCLEHKISRALHRPVRLLSLVRRSEMSAIEAKADSKSMASLGR